MAHMSDGDKPVDDKQSGKETSAPGSGPDGGGQAPERPEGEETFDRAYVEKLRKESADYRTKAKRSDDLQARLLDAAIREGTAGVLEDPTDLRIEPEDVMDDDGFPDVEKVRAAAQELAKEKPHLARRRPAGDVGQGARQEPAKDVVDIFSRTLRDAAG